MSHFAVLVVGDVESQLAPYHEFECTGRNDQFVVDVDITDKAHAEYAEWRKHSGKDEPFLEFVQGYYGSHPVPHGEQPDIADEEGEHMYGYCLLDENGVVTKVVDRTNPNAKWDWWQVGGRFRGFFKLRDDAQHAEMAQVGEAGAFDNDPRFHADVVRKGDVDAEGMRSVAGDKAGQRWDRFHEVVKDTPPVTPWAEFVERIESGQPAPALVAVGPMVAAQLEAIANEPLTIDTARKLYHAQPRMMALKEHDALCFKEERFNDMLLGMFDGAEAYAESREQHVQDARDSAIAAYAFVHEGKWCERGNMGWWGMASDELDRPTWGRAFSEWFDKLPDDALITVVDCHI